MRFADTRLLVDQADFHACFDFYKNILGFAVTWGEGDHKTGEFVLRVSAIRRAT